MDLIDYKALESLVIPDVANEAMSTGTKIKAALGAYAAIALGIGYLKYKKSQKEAAKQHKMSLNQYFSNKGIDPNDQVAVEKYKKDFQANVLKDIKDMCDKIAKSPGFKKNAEAAAKEYTQKLNDGDDYSGTFYYYPNKMSFFKIESWGSDKDFQILSLDPNSRCITATGPNPIDQEYSLIEFSWDYFYDTMSNIITALHEKYSEEFNQKFLYVDFTAGDDTICGIDVNFLF